MCRPGSLGVLSPLRGTKFYIQNNSVSTHSSPLRTVTTLASNINGCPPPRTVWHPGVSFLVPEPPSAALPLCARLGITSEGALFVPFRPFRSTRPNSDRTPLCPDGTNRPQSRTPLSTSPTPEFGPFRISSADPHSTPNVNFPLVSVHKD